ncbi:MAG: isocitrate lyase/phosphoenolpyruvate mutase family protein [Kiloniellales bacterium]|nr:isocitrate lyase/phosphoenolpyruvate mutase family protein [Kiloniellales bacterium]
MSTDQAAKAAAFRALHESPGLFVMPNAWDAGSARFLAAAGFPAIGTTSGGVNWRLGREDYVYTTPAEVMLEEYGRIAEAVEVPVSGDLENGYGAEPETVAETVRRSIAHGMVGGSIEDSTGEPDEPLYEAGLAVERIRAARQAADASGLPYTLTARCEVFFTGHASPLAEAVRRANLYREAGADCLFVPTAGEAETIRRLVEGIDAPLSVVAGLGDEPLTVARLEELGVRRVSTGGSLARACYGLLQRAAAEIARDGRFDYVKHAIPDPDMNAFFRAAGA